MKKYVYTFSETDGKRRQLLGGKGANLAGMTQMGIPVPPGFTITTEACNEYLANNQELSNDLWQQTLDGIKKIETQLGKIFGSNENPLLLSVRSGAPVSMPGMMDTILNLGLNDETVLGVIKKTNNATFAYDVYRRFIQMFGNVVLGVKGELFEAVIHNIKEQTGKKEDTEMVGEDWQKVIAMYKDLICKETGSSFPQDPYKQLERAVRAVFASWLIPRAITYRRINKISDDLGTAVNVQSMVFGNMGNTSGTGVAFTRNPSTGEKKFFGEFLLNAQGEDVVAGIRTPQDISELKNLFPKIYEELNNIADKLENHFQDMQDIEFTIEEEKLFLLQTRNGKRSAASALKIAVDMVAEGLISKKKAITKIDANSLDKLLHPQIAEDVSDRVVTRGLPASPGAASGQAVFTADDAEEWANNGKKVILIRQETSPEDVHGMHASQGILTACGGMTSHAAVVARGMGKPCVSGATTINVNSKQKKATIGNIVIKEGEEITINGSTGEVILGLCKTKMPDLSGDFAKVLSWANDFCSMKVLANADTPQDAKKAREFGAQGIGLCRTEHMFFSEERIADMREMILSNNKTARAKALAKLLPYQKSDFKAIFKVMEGLPVNVRLLDPPLHEFLPEKDKDIEALAKEMGLTFEQVKDQVVSLHESNPMLGHRGCRLMITYPEVAQMQVRAIMEAACELNKEGVKVLPEIMIPLVGVTEELKYLKQIIQDVINEVFLEQDTSVKYKIGTMIEVPRACMIAEDIAEVADFFSFGTNDLTQMTFGYSRDDVAKFLPYYLNHKYLTHDPFQSIDTEGVGRLMALAVGKARKVNQKMKLGICGEHGGDPDSIEFCFHNDLNYVSCSPYRVPIARLAVAQSYIKKWQ